MADLPYLQRISTNQTQSMLVVDGQEKGIIDGLVLAGHYEVGPGHLLFVTDDCPYEEGLHIHLFDQTWAHLDALELGLAYTPGILDQVRQLSRNEFTFSFFGQDKWQLTVRPHSRVSMKSLLPGVVRHKGSPLKCWLVLQRLK